MQWYLCNQKEKMCIKTVFNAVAAVDRVRDFRESTDESGAAGSVRKCYRDVGAGRFRRSEVTTSPVPSQQPTHGARDPRFCVPRTLARGTAARFQPHRQPRRRIGFCRLRDRVR